MKLESKQRQLQLTELEILTVIDKVCRENNINYSLYAGTLIGAIRHKGFIPWDDDIDICMQRDEYNRFLEVWEKNPVDGYFLQNKEKEPYFMHSFSKIRKKHTTFLEHEADIGNMNIGIFVDIFPIDRAPKDGFARKMQIIRCMFYQLFTREYTAEDDGGLFKIGSKLILSLTSKSYRKKKRAKLLSKITAYNNDKNNRVLFTECMSTIRNPFPAHLLDNYTEVEFEGKMFKAFEDYEGYLTNEYGDYMKLPPKEEQTWKHQPLWIDFEKNVDELEGQPWKEQSL